MHAQQQLIIWATQITHLMITRLLIIVLRNFKENTLSFQTIVETAQPVATASCNLKQLICTNPRITTIKETNTAQITT